VNNVEEPDERDEAVRRDKGSWISGAALDPDEAEAAELAELQAKWPRWSIWKGSATGSYWACPPRPGTALLNDPDLGELGRKIHDVAEWSCGQ
jgi:hypothetical protein